MTIITVERKVLEKNDEIARRNRALFASKRIFVINLVSSPGSGKTSILERTLEYFNHRINVAVIEGDVQTDFDAQRKTLDIFAVMGDLPPITRAGGKVPNMASTSNNNDFS